MHQELLKQTVNSVRQRHKEMTENCDQTSIKQPGAETMEFAIIELADEIDRLKSRNLTPP